MRRVARRRREEKQAVGVEDGLTAALPWWRGGHAMGELRVWAQHCVFTPTPTQEGVTAILH